MNQWRPDYANRLDGSACPLCDEGRPEETSGRLRFYSSKVCDAYLNRTGVQRGFVTVIWRGGHVVEPTDLTVEQAKAFWGDALRVGRAMQTHFKPLKMNYQLLGNGDPHLHWLIAPRFVEDVAPGVPLPVSGCKAFDDEELDRDRTSLSAILNERIAFRERLP